MIRRLALLVSLRLGYRRQRIARLVHSAATKRGQAKARQRLVASMIPFPQSEEA